MPSLQRWRWAATDWRAQDHGLQLRQNYNRVAPRLAAQIGRYAHARQFKRMNKAVRTLRTRVGRVHREVARQLHLLPEAAQAKVQELLERTARILTQAPKDKSKLYALHAPEVECIGKGKAPRVRHQPLQALDLLDSASSNLHYNRLICASCEGSLMLSAARTSAWRG